MVHFLEKMMAIEEIITQRQKLAHCLTGKERFKIEGLCFLGFAFAPIAAWFLIPYSKKRLHHPRYGILYWRVLMMPVVGCMLYLCETILLIIVLNDQAEKGRNAALESADFAPMAISVRQGNT